MIFLSSPYSDADHNVENERYAKTMYCFTKLCKQGNVVFSPILMCHDSTRTYNLPGDAAYWERANTQFLRRCDMMMVLCLPGWARSKGVQAEIKLARAMHLSIHYININGVFLDKENLPA